MRRRRKRPNNLSQQRDLRGRFVAGDGCSTNDVFFNQQTEISKTEIRDEETAFGGYNANEQSYDSLLPDCLPCKDNYCHNCFRCSTHQIPLLFLSVPSSKLVRRVYGTKYSSESHRLLCFNCERYTRVSHRDYTTTPQFHYAWPSVI